MGNDDHARWGIAMIMVGAAVLVGNALLLGMPALNFAGAALVLLPVVLYLVRVLERAWRSGAP